MEKINKIVLRKRIKDYDMITGFVKLSKIKLPNPPLEIPVEDHCRVVSWYMDMKRPTAVEEYKKILNLFGLPFKTNDAARLYFKIKRLCWWDILFEVYEVNS